MSENVQGRLDSTVINLAPESPFFFSQSLNLGFFVFKIYTVAKFVHKLIAINLAFNLFSKNCPSGLYFIPVVILNIFSLIFCKYCGRQSLFGGARPREQVCDPLSLSLSLLMLHLHICNFLFFFLALPKT